MEKVYLNAMNGTLVGNKIYFASREINMVYSLDLNSHTVEVLESPPGERTLQLGLYGNIVHACGKLVLVPFCAEKIWVYDLQESRWQGIALGEKEGKRPNKFFGAVVYGEYVYMFGHYYPDIIRLNVNSGTVEKIKLPFKESSDGLFNVDYVRKEEWIYLPVAIENKVLKFNLRTRKYELISVGSNKNRYGGIAWDGKWFWLSPRRNGNYVLWDGAVQVREYPLPREFSVDQDYFCGVSVMYDQVVFLGYKGRSLVFRKDAPERPSVLQKNMYFSIQMDDDTLLIQDEKGTLFRKRNDQEEEFEYFGDSQIWDNMVKVSLSKTGNEELCVENAVVTLERWMEYLPGRETAVESAKVGKRIHERMKST